MDYAPGQGKTPLPTLSDPLSEPLSFPDLFPLGKGHFNDPVRKALIDSKSIPKLSRKEYAKHRLYNSDRKFAMDPEFIFFTMSCVERESINNAVTIHLQKSRKVSTEGIRLTAGLFSNNLISTEALINNIDAFRYMKDVKGTPAFWQRVKSDALGMVSQLGTFTWFVTFSFNDLIYSIPAILTLMGIEPTDQLLSDISWHRKHELIRTDPVTAVRMFDRYIHKVISYLIEKKQVLGPAEAYLGRDEFGDRGSPHLHMMLKCLGAPKVGIDSIESIIKYIDRYVTTKTPTPEEDLVLSKLVKLQTHAHTKTCTKGLTTNNKDKSNKSKGETGGECRFHFPWLPSDRTKIVDADDNELSEKTAQMSVKNKGRRQRIILQRSVGAEWTNAYNETMLRCLRSNIDVQFCTSMWDMVNYLINYATKTEKDVCDAMKDVKNNIMDDDNRNARDKLKSLGNVFIDARSISIQESVIRTTDMPMKFSKPKVIFVPSDMPEERHGMLKSRKDMADLPDSSDDIFMKGYIDRYPSRPDSLKDMCYKEFAANFERCSSVTKSNKDRVIHLKDPSLGLMIKRTSPQIVRSHTPSRKTQPDRYFYSKICLYFPWTDESQILGCYPSLEASFVAKSDVIKSNMHQFEHIDEETLDSMIQEVMEDIVNSHVPNNPNEDNIDPRGLASYPPSGLKKCEDTENFKFTYEEPPITDEDYNEMVTSLNEQQRKIFTMIETHAQLSSEGKKVNQLIHFISGAGGVGKSFLITAIRHCINRTFKRGSHNSAVLVSASTGVAAALIDGQTIHQLLQLDCQEGGFFNQKTLNSAKRDKMFNSLFKNVKYLIVDEVSMIGNTNLNQIHSRLNQLYGMKGTTDFFGGINIIFVGDLFQIPPVQQSKIFDPRGLAALGINFWKDLVSFSELNEVVRSKGDTEFTSLCHRLRIGVHTDNDIKTLKSRVIPKLPSVQDLMSSMLLVSTNAKCKAHNDRCVEHLKSMTTVHNITAHDKFSNEQFNNPDQCDKRDKKNIKDYITDDINKTAGLPTSIILGVGARVMVRSNIDVTDKICNGVCGTVKYIKFKHNCSSTTDVPNDCEVSATTVDKVYILFDNDKVGKKIKHVCGKFCTPNCHLVGTVPISPLEKHFKCKKARKTNVWLKRFQLPFTLCWASTIHKCQGVTLKRAYIDLSGINWKAGMAYTAISRLTSLAGLFLISFDPKCIRTDMAIVQEYERLRRSSEFLFTPLSHPTESNVDRVATDVKVKVCAASDVKIGQAKIVHSTVSTKRDLSSSGQCSSSKKIKLDTNQTSGSKRSIPELINCDEPLKRARIIKSPINQDRGDKYSDTTIFSSDSPMHNTYNRGTAFVIDFFNDQQSRNIAASLVKLGFRTKTAISNIQHDVSCGYIAARTVSKLLSINIAGGDCFDSTVQDCNYYGPSNYHSQSLDMVTIGNINLGLQGSHPHFLYASQCLQLIPFYSMIYYNCPIGETPLHLLNIEQPLSISAFQNRLKTISASKNSIPTSFFIVNASDGDGTHWFTVVLKMNEPIPAVLNEP